MLHPDQSVAPILAVPLNTINMSIAGTVPVTAQGSIKKAGLLKIPPIKILKFNTCALYPIFLHNIQQFYPVFSDNFSDLVIHIILSFVYYNIITGNLNDDFLIFFKKPLDIP